MIQKKSKRGVTLIALVITIVVVFIIAGINSLNPTLNTKEINTYEKNILTSLWDLNFLSKNIIIGFNSNVKSIPIKNGLKKDINPLILSNICFGESIALYRSIEINAISI